MKKLYRKPVYAGIKYNNDQVTFSWSMDSQKYDAIYLVQDTSGKFDEDDVLYVYGYQYSKNATKEDESAIRNWLKYHIFNDNNIPHYEYDYLDKFIDTGIDRIEKYVSFRQLDGIISIGDDSDLLTEMLSHLSAYTTGFCVDMTLVKRMYDEIEFDSNAAKVALQNSVRGFSKKEIDRIVKRVEHIFYAKKQQYKLYAADEDAETLLKEEGLDKFEMKLYKPREVRHGFYNFLKFKHSDYKKLYEEMQGGTYLLYDDFYTSGATVKEAIRYLKSINDKNRIIVFVLVKQY